MTPRYAGLFRLMLAAFLSASCMGWAQQGPLVDGRLLPALEALQAGADGRRGRRRSFARPLPATRAP